ncbi:MAG: NADH-quinone oxidoreductase subunit NuoH [bacterium]
MTIFYILLLAIIKGLILITMLLLVAATNVYVERRIAAFIQQRIGPNRVGPFGLLQPFADVLKLFLKEDIVPDGADKAVHGLAPVISLFATFTVWSVIPFADSFQLFGYTIQVGIAPDVNIGLLFILAMTSVGIYGITLAGWSSNNKYSLLGGLRASAQMISYELSMGLAIIGVIIISGSFNLTDIVHAQANAWGGFRWNVFLQPVGFMIFLISAFAETNRAPFDFPEAEQELVAGYNTEYSGMRFGMFFLAEYVNITLSATFIVLLYFGGWALPFRPEFTGLITGSPWLALVQLLWFILKIWVLVFFIMWVRWTLPRFRYDQLMHIGWKILMPIAILNIIITAIVVHLL